jgi:hypothetical protein
LIIKIFIYVGVALMKKLFIYSLFILLSASYTLFSFSGNGSGTESDPYQITTVEQLQEMNNDLDAHYILMNDIDASETREWNNGKGFDPIGYFYSWVPKYAFTGSLNGQSYTISYLYIDRPNEYYVGLFGCINDGGYVHHVKIENADITGNEYIGIFVGRSYAYSEDSVVVIEYCSSGGSATGISYVGGFCGENHACGWNSVAMISDSYAFGDANGGNNVGGFCGQNNAYDIWSNAIIMNSYASGNVNGNNNVGGLCGQNYAEYGFASVWDSYASGDVNGNNNVGGLCGYNYTEKESAIIMDSYASGNAKGKDNVGGFCGYNYTSHACTSAMIADSYASGDAKGDNNVGGFCGQNYAYSGTVHIHDSYAFGDAKGKDKVGGFCGQNKTYNIIATAKNERCYSIGVPNGNSNVGGFCGLQEGSGSEEITYSYWNTSTSKIDTSDGGIGNTTIQMKIKSTFDTWDFENIWSIDPNINYGYPHLRDIYTLDVPNMSFNKHSDLFSVHPNPSNDMITVSTINEDQIFKQIEIVDVTGSVVFKKSDISLFSINIPVQDFPIGVYYVRTYINDQPHISPFIINR